MIDDKQFLTRGSIVKLHERRAVFVLANHANIDIISNDGWVCLRPGDIVMILGEDTLNPNFFHVLSSVGLCRINIVRPNAMCTMIL